MRIAGWGRSRKPGIMGERAVSQRLPPRSMEMVGPSGHQACHGAHHARGWPPNRLARSENHPLWSDDPESFL